MNTRLADNPIELDSAEDLDLSTVLSAWDAATSRLQQTHELLRCEVRRLSDELETKNRELARENRLADLGRMAAHIAHEVRNSLAPMTLYTGLLHRQTQDSPKLQATVAKISAGVTALDATVNDLLNFTADRIAQRRPTAVAPLLHETVEAIRPQFEAQQIEAAVEAADVQWELDRDMIRRAVLNLLLNAIDALPAGGEVRLDCRVADDRLQIVVSDNGEGFSEDVRGRLFEPFFTTRSRGSGLGLPIVQRIVAAHDGVVEAGASAAGGAQITIQIPPARKGGA